MSRVKSVSMEVVFDDGRRFRSTESPEGDDACRDCALKRRKHIPCLAWCTGLTVENDRNIIFKEVKDDGKENK